MRDGGGVTLRVERVVRVSYRDVDCLDATMACRSAYYSSRRWRFLVSRLLLI